jgi:opacity protein-like surface antigen
MKTQKIGMALAAALAVASQAQAEGWGHHKAVESGRIEELEEQLQSLKQELADLKAHQQAHHQEMAELKGAQEQFAPVHKGPDSLLFFRGGYARLMSDRAKDILPSPGDSDANGQNGFYIGAGFEHTLSRDLFGLTEGTPLDGTDLLGEVMFEYKRFAQGKSLLTDSDNDSVVAPLGGRKQETSTVTQFTLTAAPKIKLWRESVIRPWIIPVGFAVHVISPPSDGVTVFNPGMMFGAGAEVKVWENLYAGLDFRYHVTPGSKSSLSGVEDTDTDGLTAGGYIGFGF